VPKRWGDGRVCQSVVVEEAQPKEKNEDGLDVS